MNYPSRTVASVPRPPDIKSRTINIEVICLDVLGAGGRGTETTVLLGGRMRLDINELRVETQQNVISHRPFSMFITVDMNTSIDRSPCS